MTHSAGPEASTGSSSQSRGSIHGVETEVTLDDRLDSQELRGQLDGVARDVSRAPQADGSTLIGFVDAGPAGHLDVALSSADPNPVWQGQLSGPVGRFVIVFDVQASSAGTAELACTIREALIRNMADATVGRQSTPSHTWRIEA